MARHYKVFVDSKNIDAAITAYESNPLVERVERVGIHAMYATPNDGYFSYQWHLDQANGHDIDAPEAWDIETGADATVVAILDSGTRYYHPDLGGANASVSNPGASRGNMWINNSELNGSSGVDDDGNGYIDDWIGYDFIDGVSNCWTGEDCNTKDNDPRDFNGHGTHTAGIFGMLTNDGYGMAGVAGGWGNGSQAEYGNGIKIMALRMGYSYNYLGQEYGVVMMDAAAEAFYYAADNGAKIASCSWGSSNTGGIGTAATYFLNAGGIIVVAAGNDGTQTADYLNGRGDCISVSATDQNDAAASFTTYGTWVDICAPGVGIYSTYHDHTDATTVYWSALDGTSMATPMVAGVCALIWSQNQSWTASQVETQLYNSSDNIDAYLSSTYIGKMGVGRINAYNAVNTGPPPAPVADFSGSPTFGTEPLTVDFTDLSTGSITSWSWTFGDGGTSSSQNPSYQYTSAGTYTVSLTVTGPGGSDGETKTNYITVDPCVAPVADFSGSPTSGDYPLDVFFTDLSSGATSWSWTFGDGGTSTAQNPSHTYTAAGTYTVSLTATNACGSDGNTKTNYITVTEPTVDYATLPYTTGFESGGFDQYWFSQSDNSEGRILITTANTPHLGSYHLTMDDNLNGGLYAQNEAWLRLNLLGEGNVDLTFWWKEFSDEDHTQDGVFFSDNGGSSFTKVQNLTGGSTTWQEFAIDVDQLASANGLSLTSTFVIKFQQYDNYGITTDGMAFDDVSVVAGGVPAPVAAFSGTPLTGCAPLNVTFTDASTGDISSWSWNFGDGGTSTAQNPSYNYTSGGTYTVALTVTGPGGSDVETKTNYVTVNVGPTAGFTGTPTSGTEPLDVTFTNQSTGATSYSWTFGDGGTSTATNPTYQYTTAGTYTVALTATNACGTNVDTKVDYITVNPCVAPVANFSGSPTSGTAPLDVTFTDASTGASSWSWTFGDGGTSAVQNPSYTYTTAGTYTVTLTATNACGSDVDTKTDYVTVSEPTSDYASLPYSTGFESGSFDQYWFSQSDNSEGRIQITTANTPRGSYHLTMDDNLNGGLYAQNEAWLRLDLSGKSDVDLSFWWKEFSDENHTQDGVYFSDNAGANFTKVYDLTGGTTTYQQINMDLDQLASANGLSLTSTFVVKFQQYDNYGITTDGMAFDDVSVMSNDSPPVADFSGTPTSGSYPLLVNFSDLSSGGPTSWSWTFGDGGTSTAQNPSHTYTAAGTYTVSLTATNAFGSDGETKTSYITVTEPSTWTTITYDDFEAGWGNYTDGGGDCSRYTSGSYAHQGSAALDIQDNSGVASSFYHTVGHDVSGYTELEVEFWFYAVSMDNSSEDFWLQYYDGSTWQTVETWARTTDFDNGVFYNEVVTISSSLYNFPSNAQLRFMCDASGNRDDVYIDEIEFRGMGTVSSFTKNSTVTLPEEYSLSQNYPNPFNPVTSINFSLPKASNVIISVYNVLGQEVERIADGYYQAGTHSVEWNANNKASGIYLYRIQAGEFSETRKMILLR